MERFLQPEKFDKEPNAADSTKLFAHWLKTFEGFVRKLESKETGINDEDKLGLLTNHLS